MRINKNKIIGGMIVMLFFISFGSAFSVSAPYMENKELILPLGENLKTLEFVLQNSGGIENINIRVRILQGSEIASITDLSNIYTVVPGDKVPVNIEIKIPEEAQVGDSYHIKLGFSTETGEQTGVFGFGVEIEQNFDVITGEAIQTPGEEVSSWVYYLIVGIIAIGIIIAIVLKRKKKKQK